jgi:hypothetical protein
MTSRSTVPSRRSLARPFAVVGVLAFALLLFWRHHEAPSQTPSAQSRRQPVEDQRALPAPPRATVHRSPEQPAAKVTTRPSSPRTTQRPHSYADEIAELAARARFYDQFLSQQDRDEPWADKIEARARSLYPVDAGTAVALEEVTCRRTMCRLTFHYGSADERRLHLMKLGNQLPELPKAGYAFPGEPSAHDGAVAYMMRTGSDLPPYNGSDSRSEPAPVADGMERR